MTVKIIDATLRKAFLIVIAVAGLSIVALSLFSWLDFTPNGGIIMVGGQGQQVGNPGNGEVVTAFGLLIVLTVLAASPLGGWRPPYLLMAVMGLAAFAVTLHDGLAEWRGAIATSSPGTFFQADGNGSPALWLTLAPSLLVSVCAGVLLGIGSGGISASEPMREAQP
jgi:hypothetical protein